MESPAIPRLFPFTRQRPNRMLRSLLGGEIRTSLSSTSPFPRILYTHTLSIR